MRRLLAKRLFVRKRYCLMASVIALSCIMIPDALKVKAAAASAAISSSGSISANNGAVVYYSTDIDYLKREADSLYSEIDYSKFDLAEAAGTVTVSGSRRNLLDSHGIINYGQDKVVANANDLLDLADQIDSLENYYASTVYRALNTIGTYLDGEGVVYHEPRAADSLVLAGFEQLAGGILQSQSVTHLESSPVTSDNITAGAAAWVNGKCIIGNGADNDRAYQRGMEDGEAGNDKNVDIRYTRHAHTGNGGVNPIPDGHVCYSTANPGGCYRSSGHTHDKTGICGTEQIDTSKECGCDIKYDEHHDGSNCSACGHAHYGRDGNYPDYCTAIITTTTTQHTCGNYVNTWKINCGKKAGQIESAEVIIYRNINAGE